MRGAGRLSMADPDGAPERDQACGPAPARPAGGTELLQHSDKYPFPVHQGRAAPGAIVGWGMARAEICGRPGSRSAAFGQMPACAADRLPTLRGASG